MFSWHRFFPALIEAGYDVVAMDAPGFGRSDGAAGQANLWRADDAELVLDILNLFHPEPNSVFVLGQCMGAAMTMRAFKLASHSADTSPFANAFVFHNATIGTWVPEFEEAVASSNAKVMAWHEVDSDHMREAVCYKNLTRLQKLHPKSVEFFDNDRLRSSDPGSPLILPTDLSPPLPPPRLSRTSDNTVSFKVPTPEIVTRVVNFFNRPLTKKEEWKAPTNVTALEDKNFEASSRFKVFVRVRPLLPREAEGRTCVAVQSETDVEVDKKRFKFSRVLGQESTEANLHNTADEVITGALTNPDKNGVIFAYGQTGSGKTFTISQLMERIKVHAPDDITLRYIQVYNDEIYDMFRSNLKIPSLKAATALALDSSDDVLAVVEDANSAHRTTSATQMNEHSSRSHSLLYIDAKGGGTLCVVDLAGSERVRRSRATGKSLKEATEINTSLLALIRVLNSTIDPKAKHVPTRDCKLTKLIAPVFLDKTCSASLYACISPAEDSRSETTSTLKFAAGSTFVGAKRKRRKQATKWKKSFSGEERDELAENFEKNDAELQVDGALVDISSGSGTTIFTRGLRAPRLDEPVTTLLLLHYYGGACRDDGSAACWDTDDLRQYHEALIEVGVNARILVPDIPGHGRSPGPAPPSTPEKKPLSHFVSDVMVPLLDYFGCDERTVCHGFDWGGGCAVALAQTVPYRVKGVVAHNASYRLEDGQREDLSWTKLVPHRAAVWTESIWHSKVKAALVGKQLGVKFTKVKGELKVMEETVRVVRLVGEG
eukprot:CAMPEP_0182465206 /NCGR_PEP_ID=MMETSP1319-20130603/9054_1 /TAXON_ID=172717 /ORGANISM="Bolidomonas pacifica, Strain RCC208" /LENGTH=772 /DNA_ID=CAMNT_0024664899 /DNA_START=405 /DNA_END=2723 /DNA_ORIENTATION=+